MIEAEIGIAVATIPVGAFPFWIRKIIRRRQDGRCARCYDNPDTLECHHLVPESRGGADVPENGRGYCSDCHEVVDKKALKHGKLPDGTPIENAPQSLFE